MNFAKLAEIPDISQAKSGEPAEAGLSATTTTETSLKSAPTPAEIFAIATETLTPKPEGDTALAATAKVDVSAAPADQVLDGDPDVVATPDAPTIEVAAGAVIPIIVPMPASAPANAHVAGPAISAASVSPIGLQASTPANSDAAAPNVPVLPAISGETDDTTPAKPQIADAVTAAPAENAVQSDDPPTNRPRSALRPSDSDDAPDFKSSPAQADHKTEPGKAKSDHPTIARNANAQPHQDAARPAAEADHQPKPEHHHPQAAERASLTARTTVAEARSELPATAAAPAQLNAATPNVPFLLATPTAMPLPHLWPVALRVEAAADNPVPVEGLAVEIVSRAQDGLRRFEIRLDPPELGRIDVRLDVDTGGKVTSRLTVERVETLDLLRRDAPQLERALQHAGLNTEGGLEFSLRDQNFAKREQAHDLPATRLIVPDEETAATEAARRGYGRIIGLGGGVDIRV